MLEFYAWPAVPAVQNRLRNLEPVPFGRLREKSPFGMVYDLSVTRSIGVGVLQWGLGALLMWGLKLIGIGALV